MSYWVAKYKALTPKTKMLIGIGMMSYAVVGLYLADTAEEKFDMKPTEEDKEKLRQMIPRVRTMDTDPSPVAKGS